MRALLIILLAAVAVYWFHFHLSPKDSETYHLLFTDYKQHKLQNAPSAANGYQTRRGVQKDFWSTDLTRHFQIKSQNSTLFLQNHGLEERLDQIHCELIGQFTLDAREGTYTFPSHQLVAKRDCLFVQDGNWVKGDQITLDIDQQIATYINPTGYLAEDNIHFSADRLELHQKTDQLYLLGNVAIYRPDFFDLRADQGTVALHAGHPETILLQKDVRLISSKIQNKPSYCLADTLTYTPKTQAFLFGANERVLFWQEGVSLSAPEILIKQDHTIEGHGDVHCSFNMEEQNYIDQFFKQYLNLFQ